MWNHKNIKSRTKEFPRSANYSASVKLFMLCNVSFAFVFIYLFFLGFIRPFVQKKNEKANDFPRDCADFLFFF